MKKNRSRLERSRNIREADRVNWQAEISNAVLEKLEKEKNRCQ